MRRPSLISRGEVVSKMNENSILGFGPISANDDRAIKINIEKIIRRELRNLSPFLSMGIFLSVVPTKAK
jgi:hypothetical protein